MWAGGLRQSTFLGHNGPQQDSDSDLDDRKIPVTSLYDRFLGTVLYPSWEQRLRWEISGRMSKRGGLCSSVRQISKFHDLKGSNWICYLLICWELHQKKKNDIKSENCISVVFIPLLAYGKPFLLNSYYVKELWVISTFFMALYFIHIYRSHNLHKDKIIGKQLNQTIYFVVTRVKESEMVWHISVWCFKAIFSRSVVWFWEEYQVRMSYD